MRRKEAGLSLIELLVAMGLAGVASGFVLSIYSRSSTSYRAQARVSELQQTLRAGADLLGRDLRQAGFGGADSIPIGGVVYAGIDVDDGGNNAAFCPGAIADPNTPSSPGCATPDPHGADRIMITRGSQAMLTPVGAAAKYVDCEGGSTCSSNKFAVTLASPALETGDVIQAIDDDGDTCWAVVTQVAPVTFDSGGSGSLCPPTCTGQRIRTKQGDDCPCASCTNSNGLNLCLNKPSNSDCDAADVDYDSDTQFQRYTYSPTATIWQVAYRIHPTDTRGMLQRALYDEATGVWGPWQTLALGFVDMQVALRVEDNNGVDEDDDLDVNRDWYSGAGLDGLLVANPSYRIDAVKVSLLARTTAEVDGVLPLRMSGGNGAPDLCQFGRCSGGDLNFNSLGNHVGHPLPEPSTTSRYYDPTGNRRFYRWSSVTVDLRNM